METPLRHPGVGLVAVLADVHFHHRVPHSISGWSVIIAVLVSSLVGMLFGTVPAARAAQLDPVESLRHE